MADPIIQMQLHPDGPLVEAPVYRDAFDSFLAILREVDRASTRAAGGAGQSIHWFIQRTASSAPVVELLAEATSQDIDVTLQVVSNTLDVFEILEGAPTHPPSLTYAGLEHCQSFGRLIRPNGLSHIFISNNGRAVTVSDKLVSHVTELLGQREEIFGSIEGELEMVTLRGRRHFNVYSLVTGKATRCYFDTSLLPKVKESLGQVVIVSGLLRSLPHDEGQEMSSISTLEVIDIESLPTPSDIKGIMPNLTRGKPSEQYLKERWGGRQT